jgi:putative salt-induced outer membrane protein YdiY
MMRAARYFAALMGFCVCLQAVAEDVPVLPLQRLSMPAKDLMVDWVAKTNPPAWQSSATFGLTMTRGNSDTLLATAKLQTQWKSKFNECLLGAGGAYGEDESVKNRENFNGYGQFNHFFTGRSFVFGRADGLHDGIKDIQYRFTASTGLGYCLVQRTNTSFVVELGPAMVSEKQGSQKQTYGAFRFAERFDYKINSITRIWQTAELIPQLDRSENFVVNAEIGVEAKVAKNMGLQVLIQNNYVNEPAVDYQRNDVRLVSGLSYKF